MPFANGVFTRVRSWVQDKANGLLMQPDLMDQDANDIAQALSMTWLRDGSVQPTADMPMGNRKLRGLGAPAMAGDAVPLGASAYFSKTFPDVQNLSYPAPVIIAQVQFSPLLANVKVEGRCSVATSDGGAEITYLYMDIYDVAGQSVVTTGQTDIATANSTAYGKVVAGAGLSAMGMIGRTYLARLWASQGDANHNVGARSIVIEGQIF